MKTDNETVKLNRELIVTVVTLVLIFAFLVCAVTCYCWYVDTREADAKGFSVRAEFNSGLFTDQLRVYRHSPDEGVTEVFENEVVPMTAYDTVFQDNNEMTAFIMRCAVYGLPYDENGRLPLRLEFGYNPGEWLTAGGDLMNVLSNIVEVRAAFGTAELNAKENPDEVYNGAMELLGGASVPVVTFVTKNDSGYEKQNDLYLDFNDYSGSIMTDAEDHEYLVLYIEVNYNDALIEDYIEANDISIETGIDDETVDFPCDLTDFVLRGVVK